MSHPLITVFVVAVSSISREEARAAFDPMDQMLQALHGSEQSKTDQLYLLELLARVQTSAAAAVGEIAAAIAESGAYSLEHFKDAGACVAFVTGVSVGEGHRIVETAQKVREFPQLREDFAAGLISSDETRSIVEAASVAPEQLDSLIEIARNDTMGALNKESRRIRAIALGPKSAEEAAKKTYVKFRPADPFGHRVNGYVTNEMLGNMAAKLNPLTDRLARDQHKNDTFISRNHCQAQGLVELVARGGSGKQPRPHVIFAVDLEAALQGELRPGERCEIPGIGPVPLKRVYQLLDKAHISLVVKDGKASTAGTMGRYPNAQLKREMEIDSDCCDLLGCDEAVHLDGDHNQECRDGGETNRANMGKLCSGHHKFKTDYRMKLVGPPGRKQMVPLDPGEMWGRARDGPQSS